MIFKSQESMNLKNDNKIHSHWLVRKMNTFVIRWKIQKRRHKVRQGVLLLFCCFFMQILSSFLAKRPIPIVKAHPRAIHLNDNFEIDVIKEYVHLQHRTVDKMSKKKINQDTSVSPFEEGNCKAMASWQKENYSTCNPIHEIGAMYEMQHLAKGGFRDVWWALDGDGSDVVVKTLVWKKNFKQRERYRHERDANAYAALQSSIHIPNIYGYCECILSIMNAARMI